LEKKDPTEIYYELRNLALKITPEQIQVKSSEEFPTVYGILMELGMTQAAVTLVILADGTVSLYYETGGGIIGAGGHENVRNAAVRLIQTAEQRLDHFNPTQDFPLPQKGWLKFYLLTFNGILAAEMSQEDLNEENPLSSLVIIGNEVLNELRTVDEKSRTRVR
jgi:hypothetical protein